MKSTELQCLARCERGEAVYLCPADDLAVGLELRAMEDLDASDGLHGLSIDGTYHSVEYNAEIVLNKKFKYKTNSMEEEEEERKRLISIVIS